MLKVTALLVMLSPLTALAAEAPSDAPPAPPQVMPPPAPSLPAPPRAPDPNEVKTLTVKQLQDIIEAARLQGVNQGRAEAAHMIEINEAASKVFADLDKQKDEKKPASGESEKK